MMYLTSRNLKQKVFHVNRSDEGEASVFPVVSFLIEACNIEYDPTQRTPAETRMLSELLEWGSETQCNSDDTTWIFTIHCFNEELEISVLDSSWNF